jgi:hypothetical protein
MVQKYLILKIKHYDIATGEVFHSEILQEHMSTIKQKGFYFPLLL